MLKQSPAADPDLLDSQVQRLTDENQMGEIYKVQFISNSKIGEVFPFVAKSDLTYD